MEEEEGGKLEREYVSSAIFRVCVYFITAAPRIALVSTSEAGVEAEDRVTLTCTVSKGDSPLSIVWYRDGVPLPSHGSRSDDITIVSLNAYNSVLGIERVGPRHGGRYSCRAANAAGTDVLTYSLSVNGTFFVSFIIMIPIACIFLSSLTFVFHLPSLQFLLA